MQLVTKDEFYIDNEKYLEKIIGGAVFVYPTDTIYGIGCNALDSGAVKKIRELKDRKDKAFSVIVPSKEWIMENCVVTDVAQEYIENDLPGPITLILELKNKDAVCKDVLGKETSIGVRIPKHWIRGFVKHLNVPIVTTSVNQTGKKPMTSVEDIDPEIKAKVSFIIDEGLLPGSPSKIIHLEGKDIKVRER